MVLTLKDNIKNKNWWKKELKDFGLNNLLIILAIILIFSGFYFEFAPKIRNPCDWCMIQVSGGKTISCSELVDFQQNINNKKNIIPKINLTGEYDGT